MSKENVHKKEVGPYCSCSYSSLISDPFKSGKRSQRKKTVNTDKSLISFKSKENIHKKEVGPYHSFGYLNLISDPLNLANGASRKKLICKF